MTDTIDTENQIVRLFAAKFKLTAQRTAYEIPNYIFHVSQDGLRPELYKGIAIVRRYPGSRQKISLPLSDVKRLLDQDEKGVVIIGFNDVAAWAAPSNKGLNIVGDQAVLEGFSIIAERKGCYV